MITVLLLLSFVASFIFCWYTGQYDLAASCLQIFAIYALCCLIDTVIGVFNLGRSIEGKVKILKPLSAIGRVFSSYQELLNFRINSEVPEKEEDLTGIRTPQPEREEDLDSFMRENLQELDRSFKPVMAAVIYKEGSSDCKVSHKGLRGKRFEEQLKSLFSDQFEKSEWLGIQDTLRRDFPSEDFSVIGIRFIVSAAFSRFSLKGIICLGFESERRPQAQIHEKLQFFATDLERELGTLKNFQELKQLAQKAEEKSEERSRFLTEVSHDIRSPLNNVRTILSILREDLKDVTDGERLIDTALNNCDLADDLVESLMNFAKLRAGKLKAIKADFSLTSLVEEVVRVNAISAGSKSLTLSFNKPKEHVYCHGDRMQIKRVINNLIGNAIKYTDYGRVSVSLTLSPEGSCLVRVADSGCGISASQLEQLFTPFARFSQQEGVGLGLALSKALVEANAGTLEVKSEIDLGTVFALSLPAAHQGLLPDTEQIESKLLAFPGSGSKSLNNLKIFIIDDDIDSAESLRRYLSNKGADCKSEFTTVSALEVLEQEKFDAIICDCKMPNGGGKQVVMKAAKRSDKPVIIMVSGDIREANSLIEYGASCAMQKPLDLQRLEEYLYDLFFAYKTKLVGN